MKSRILLNSQMKLQSAALLACFVLASCTGASGDADSVTNTGSGAATPALQSTDTTSNSGVDDTTPVDGNSDVVQGAGDTDDSTESVVISLDNTFDYSNQAVPAYIQKDNTGSNVITNAGAALGRVLFYDTALSTNNQVSCSSCHQQSVGFSDSNVVSSGVNGVTARHSMRLINSRFSVETQFFWDERANSLEQQATQPIRDHGEMGFSGTNGAPTFDQLITTLANTDYYPELFTQAFGNSVITEERMQDALAQFIRSIQSFDSRYDQGRAQARNNNSNFANFTDAENEGKRLFMERGNFDAATGQRQPGGGLGCNGCHRAPEFDIDENSRNNGVISVAGNVLETDISNTRSPSLRDLFNADGIENGPFMHDGSLATFDAVLDHYNDITVNRLENRNLDGRLNGTGGNGNNGNAQGQKLQLTAAERSAITAFMKTLTGRNIYSDPKWSNPFSDDGSLDLSR